MTEQQPENLFEAKVPIFCEFVFQENLATNNFTEDSTPFYEHVIDSLEPEKSITARFDEYALPGFPEIKYYLALNAYSEVFIFEFHLEVDYATYFFEVDFTCTINNNEPQHFHDIVDSRTIDDAPDDYLLLTCSDECAGCAACEDKTFVVRVEGFITVKRVDHLPIKLDYSFEDFKLYDKNDTKDFVFVVEGKEIWVHKSILIKNSTVFARMLDSDKWKETMENKIVIPEFSFKVVEFAIKAFYGLTLSNLLEKDYYLMVFQFVDKYDMEKLKNTVKKCIVLTPSSVVEYANFFLHNYADELVDCCIDYIFVCSQNSFSLKNIENLDPRIRSMFFDRTLISPVLKKDPKVGNHTVYYNKKYCV